MVLVVGAYSPPGRTALALSSCACLPCCHPSCSASSRCGRGWGQASCTSCWCGRRGCVLHKIYNSCNWKKYGTEFFAFAFRFHRRWPRNSRSAASYCGAAVAVPTPVPANRCCFGYHVHHFFLLFHVLAAAAALVADIAFVAGLEAGTLPAIHCSRSALSVLGGTKSAVAVRRWWP